MTFIDVLFNLTMILGTALGAIGALILIGGAAMSFFVDSAHPALQPTATNGHGVASGGIVDQHDADGWAVAA